MLLIESVQSRQFSVSPIPNRKGKYSRLKLISLLNASSTSHRADVDHTITVLNKRTALARQLHARDILQAEINEGLVSLLAEVLDETVAGKRLAETDSCQSVLGEAEVEEGVNVDAISTELFLLLCEI